MEEGVDKINETDTWSIARRYSKLLGPVPSSISNAVKNLWKDHLVSLSTESVEISFSSNSAVRLVDKSSVLKMPLYFAAQSLYPDRFSQLAEDDASKAMIKILHPGLFSVLLSLIYVHRRFNKICPADQWEALSKEFVLNMELGYLIGKGSPRIGEAVGALIGGIRYAALAIFLKHDPDGYKGYRNIKKTFDVSFENERWGCDHGQVAALIIKALGISSEQFVTTGAIRGYPVKPVEGDYSAWRAAVLLIDAVKQQKDLEAVDLSETGIELSVEELSNISQQIAVLFEKGSTFTWMLRGSRVESS